VYIDGAYDVMPRGQMWPAAGDVHLKFGAAIHPENFDRGRGREARREAYAAMTGELRRRIIDLRPMSGRSAPPTQYPFDMEGK
jgi:hypothetical protein